VGVIRIKARQNENMPRNLFLAEKVEKNKYTFRTARKSKVKLTFITIVRRYLQVFYSTIFIKNIYAKYIMEAQTKM